jgi:DNA polymerase III delta prime subunit
MSWEDTLKMPREKPRKDIEFNQISDLFDNLKTEFMKLLESKESEIITATEEMIEEEYRGEALSRVEIEEYNRNLDYANSELQNAMDKMREQYDEIISDIGSNYMDAMNSVFDTYFSSTEAEARAEAEAEKRAMAEYERRQGFY